VAEALRRAAELLVEPAAGAPPRDAPLDVVVTALSAGAGATTVSRGLALALRRLRPVELAGTGRPGYVTAGPGMAVIRDTAPGEARRLCHRGVLIAVADARREPALAALVVELLCERNERVLLVGNRARDAAAWHARGALCVPESRLGAWLVSRGRRPPGAMGTALDALAAQLQ
jgi:hypothetical protein